VTIGVTLERKGGEAGRRDSVSVHHFPVSVDFLGIDPHWRRTDC